MATVFGSIGGLLPAAINISSIKRDSLAVLLENKPRTRLEVGKYSPLFFLDILYWYLL
jgi:hypothetical protein